METIFFLNGWYLLSADHLIMPFSTLKIGRVGRQLVVVPTTCIVSPLLQQGWGGGGGHHEVGKKIEKSLFLDWIKKYRFCLLWQSSFLHQMVRIPQTIKLKNNNSFLWTWIILKEWFFIESMECYVADQCYKWVSGLANLHKMKPQNKTLEVFQDE